MPRVLNKYKDKISKNAINIMRPSKWGNPFVIGKDGDRPTVIAKFKRWLLENEELMEDLYELRGKDLVCCCKPQDCHGDILIEFANKNIKNPFL